MATPGRALAPEQRRRLAVGMVADGESPEQIADLLDVSERSVWRWLQAYRRYGETGLITKAGQGRPAVLTEDRARGVLGWIEQSPGVFGYITQRWTAPRVTALIARFFGVQMNHRYVSRWLRERGITPQMPQRVPRERNELVIQQWIADQWPLIKAKVAARGASLVFTDESGFLLLPLVRRTLARIGHTPKLRHRARHRDKVSVAAALMLSPARHHISLHFQTYPNAFINNIGYSRFLRQILWHIPQPVVVVQDQGSVHKGDPIRDLHQDFPRLDLNMLPPYAPELNPVEHVWNYEKDKRLSNYVPQNLTELNATICFCLSEVRHNQQRLRSFLAATPLPWDGLTIIK